MSEVWRGRKENGRARMLRARENRPPPRSVPSSIVQKGFEPNVHEPSRPSARERRVIRAWDNMQGVGEKVVWNRDTCMSNLVEQARKSGAHVHDGPARYNVGPIEPRESKDDRARDIVRDDANYRANTIKQVEALAFVRQRAREKRER